MLGLYIFIFGLPICKKGIELFNGWSGCCACWLLYGWGM